MKSKIIDQSAEKTFAVVFDTGEEAIGGLTSFAKQHGLTSAHFTGIGAFSRVVLGYYDWETKEYLRIPIEEQGEVVSLIGDIALEKEHPKIHAHVVIGRRNGLAMGGHLIEGVVRPTLEVVLIESPSHLQRKFDPQSGLALIRL
jgi:predicted DNA-binding protein with PD1-like motif